MQRCDSTTAEQAHGTLGHDLYASGCDCPVKYVHLGGWGEGDIGPTNSLKPRENNNKRDEEDRSAKEVPETCENQNRGIVSMVYMYIPSISYFNVIKHFVHVSTPSIQTAFSPLSVFTCCFVGWRDEASS